MAFPGCTTPRRHPVGDHLHCCPYCRLHGTDACTTIPLLGQIPLDVELRSGGDDGDPIVITHPDSPAAEAITELAKTIDARPRGLVGINLGVQPVSH